MVDIENWSVLEWEKFFSANKEAEEKAREASRNIYHRTLDVSDNELDIISNVIHDEGSEPETDVDPVLLARAWERYDIARSEYAYIIYYCASIWRDKATPARNKWKLAIAELAKFGKKPAEGEPSLQDYMRAWLQDHP